MEYQAIDSYAKSYHFSQDIREIGLDGRGLGSRFKMYYSEYLMIMALFKVIAQPLPMF